MDMCPLQHRSSLKPEAPRLHREANSDDVDPARQQRIEQLRLALATGTYRPALRLVAERLLASGDLGCQP
jgi:hypothetical protein